MAQTHEGGATLDTAAMANALRVLTMDAVATAKSGHSGMPMGMADVATTLFTRVLSFDAAAPDWPDRDRFVLSAGHGSMLLYGLGYLLGYEDMPIDQLRAFRQLGSRTAGHPEHDLAAIVETTTGPLGQGLANAVGMAVAEAHLAARFGSDLVDHRTFVIAGDGDLMEGISQEAITLAGHLRLRKLTVLFDDNEITIDGPASLSDSTDQIARFAAAGWSTQEIDGHDPAAIAEALDVAAKEEQPSLIACRTVIGRGFPTQAGTSPAHGAITNPVEIAGARDALGWPHPPFEVPEEVLSAWRTVGARGRQARLDWERRAETALHASAFRAALSPTDSIAGAREIIAQRIDGLLADPPKLATRAASGKTLAALTPVIDTMVGGSADLTGSNNTRTPTTPPLTADTYEGRYLHYGVREHAMAAVMNGMALHGGVIPYGGTFLVFSDYARPALRLAALMGLRCVFVFTHDSIGVGEDGPTHQPVEHLAALRAIPNLQVLRPADAVETAECWEIALASQTTPTVLALTRQALEPVRREPASENLSALGGYVLHEAGDAAVTLLASGSEVSLAVAAREQLAADGVAARVVSLPSFERFAGQSPAYQAEVLGETALRVGVEAGVRQGWDAFLRPGDSFVGMTGFGASAPAAEVFAHFGLTPANVATLVKAKLEEIRRGA
ncbi:MAG: transketolase [Caulobacterales bacterium]|nr:transketolase [Caulobacterales bacterium]